jgi:hypothetical protein
VQRIHIRRYFDVDTDHMLEMLSYKEMKVVRQGFLKNYASDVRA